MKSSAFSRFVIILLLALSACQSQIAPTSTPTDLSPAPTPDPGIITPENIGRLVQIKQMGMGQAVGSPHYSPDGSRMFQATSTGVYVFDQTTTAMGRLLDSYGSFPSDNEIMDISPDGKILAIGDDLVWVESGQKLPNIESLPDNRELTEARNVKFSHYGTLIARGYNDLKTGVQARVGVWRLADGRLLQSFAVNSRGRSFEFSSDSHWLSVQNGETKDPVFDVYDIRSGKKLVSWAGDRAVSLPENRLAVESDGAIRIFDLATQKAPHAFFGEFAAFSPDGQLVVLLNFGQFKIYRVSDEQQQGTLEGNFTNIDSASLRFSPDGQTLAGYAADYCCGGHTGEFYLWRVADGTVIKKMDEPPASGLFNFSPDGKSLAITAPITSTLVFSTADGSLQSDWGKYSFWLTGVAFFPDSRQLVISTAENNTENYSMFPGDYQSPLFFYNIDNGILAEYQYTMKHNKAGVAFSTDGKIYAPDELRDLPFIKDIKARASSIAFSPDGRKVAIGYTDRLYVWDLSKKILLFQSSVCPYADISSLAFSPDGQKVARVCVSGILENGDPSIQVWEAVPQGEKLLDIFTGYGVFMVTFSPDGRFLAAGGDQVGVWDATDGQPLFTIPEAVIDWGNYFGRLGLQTLAFSPDGRILAINSTPGSAELWAVESHRRIFSLADVTFLKGGPVTDIDFSPDGKLLAIGLERGGARIYGIDPAEPVHTAQAPQPPLQ